MKNKKTLILTGTTDINRTKSETDNTMEEVFNLTLPSKQRYVKKHGYDLLSLRSFGDGKKYNFKETDIGFLRIMTVFQMLEYYDIIMWLDADSIITNDELKIEDFLIEENVTFYASYDWHGKTSFSAGNFIIQNTKYLKEFIDTFYSIAKYFSEEQQTLNQMYFNTAFKNTMKILEHKFLGSIPSIEMYKEQWAGRKMINFPWNASCFLAHIGGIPNYARIKILKENFERYL
jgi:hypothetical protein